MRRRLPSLLLGVVAAGWVQADEAKRTFIRVGPVTLGTLLDSEIALGCGCSFHSPKHRDEMSKSLVQWEIDGSAAVFVNGELLRLKVETPYPVGSSVGDKSPVALSSSTVRLSGTMTTTWVCPRERPWCEMTRARGTVRIVMPNGSAKVPLEGVCGC